MATTALLLFAATAAAIAVAEAFVEPVVEQVVPQPDVRDGSHGAVEMALASG